MTPYDRVIERLIQLIEQGDVLRQGDERGHVSDATQYQDARGWITAACNIVLHIFPDGDSPYAQHLNSAVENGENCNLEYVAGTVGEIRAVLKNLLTDLEGGLL